MDKNKKVLYIVVGACVFLVLAVALVLAYSGRDVTTLQDRQIRVKINGQEIIIPLDENLTVIDVPCLMTSAENIFVLENDPSATVTVEDKKLKTGRKKKITIPKIAENYRLTMTIATSKDERTVYLRSYSSLLPKGDLSEQVVDGEETLVTMADQPVMYILDGSGNIIWYQAQTLEQTNGSLFSNFQKQMVGDDVYYTYHLSDPDVTTYGIADYTPGQEILLDEKMRPVENSGSYLTLMDTASLEDEDIIGLPTDNKGFILLSKKSFICEGIEITHPDNIPESLKPSDKVKVAGCVVQEVKNDKIVWEWRSTSMPELYSLSVSGCDYSSGGVQDYLHLNKMTLSEDEKTVLLTFRYTDKKVRIDRETGQATIE